MMTEYGGVSDVMLLNRFDTLVNQFFKILPIRENNEETLQKYIDSLLREMIGMGELLKTIGDDDLYLTLLSTLNYMRVHPCDVGTVKTDVFKCIRVIKKLQKKYSGE